jgi:nucleoside-diphosphate-sugar epimerase
MRHVAILGASSQIARDLILSFAAQGEVEPLLYVRDVEATRQWLARHALSFAVAPYAEYGLVPHDAVINFVGVGDPQRAAAMGASIFSVTQQFDDLVMAGLRQHPERRYIFLSSGAAYGSTFLEPANADTVAHIAINALPPQEYYAVAKLHAEARHRSEPGLAITDLRVFNYFSRTQDLNARFFITDILRAIRDGVTLRTSADYMVRDFLHPSDFHRLVTCVLAAPPRNMALDCYTRAPVDKPALLAAMSEHFGLVAEIAPATAVAVNATGAKPHYYSLNRKAAEIGYQPVHSSLEGLLLESRAILGLPASGPVTARPHEHMETPR